MNELICTTLIFVVTLLLGIVIYACSKIIPAITDNIKGFIRWRRTMSGKKKDVYYRDED